ARCQCLHPTDYRRERLPRQSPDLHLRPWASSRRLRLLFGPKGCKRRVRTATLCNIRLRCSSFALGSPRSLVVVIARCCSCVCIFAFGLFATKPRTCADLDSRWLGRPLDG